MMVTARVADSGLVPRRSPFERAAGEEKIGPKSRFTAFLVYLSGVNPHYTQYRTERFSIGDGIYFK